METEMIHNWTEQKLRQLKPSTKFQTEYMGIVTAKKIINESWGWKGFHDGDFDKSLKYNFGNIEILKKTQLWRDNQIHNYDCEFACGKHCNCWCGEKYHGLLGVGAKIIEVKN